MRRFEQKINAFFVKYIQKPQKQKGIGTMLDFTALDKHITALIEAVAQAI